MSRLALLFIFALILIIYTCCSVFALNPHEVLVVYNARPSILEVSKAVADYYADARNIPASNIVLINTFTEESVDETEYLSTIARPFSLFRETLSL